MTEAIATPTPLIVERTRQRQARLTTDVEVVIPAYNEDADLEASVRRLHRYLTERFPLTWLITIADNASRDQTWGIACRLAAELDGVRAIHLDEKGRGLAVRAAWSSSAAAVVAYMDADLSTDLDALLPLVAPLLSGHSDIAIGSRLAPGARVVRRPTRELLSRGYNLILKATLHNGFSDAQCGFKAVRAEVARALLPLVEDNAWFFDTELLVLAEHNGFRIHEVPVDWVDDPCSTVHVGRTAVADLKGIWRMVWRFALGDGRLPADITTSHHGRRLTPGLAGQLIRFAAIGAVSTAIFAVVFITLAGPLGPIAADVIALLVGGSVNLAANRRFTFAQRGQPGRRRQYLAGFAVAAVPLALTIATIVMLGAASVTSPVLDLAVLMAVNALATVARFELLRRWVFAP